MGSIGTWWMCDYYVSECVRTVSVCVGRDRVQQMAEFSWMTLRKKLFLSRVVKPQRHMYQLPAHFLACCCQYVCFWLFCSMNWNVQDWFTAQMYSLSTETENSLWIVLCLYGNRLTNPHAVNVSLDRKLGCNGSIWYRTKYMQCLKLYRRNCGPWAIICFYIFSK